MDPAPPPWLSTELISVWSGWQLLKDREVVREAAAKGLHISLAENFIALRKQWDLDEAKRWFEAQVKCWGLELLNMRQVFKATHILTNIGLDSAQQFTETLLETKDRSLRDFLATHLIKIKKFDQNLQNNWTLAKFVQSGDNKNHNDGINYQKYDNYTLNDFLVLDGTEKTSIATFIFFSRQESSLSVYLESLQSWKYLLSHNELELLHDWIHISCCESVDYEPKRFHSNNPNFLEKVHQFFLTNPITEAMIDKIKESVSWPFTGEYVFNNLGLYGFFLNKSILNIISISAKMEELENLERILSLDSSVVTVADFRERLIQFCVKKKYYRPLVLYLNDIDYEVDPDCMVWELKVWKEMKKVIKNKGPVYGDCIFKISELTSTNGIENYLKYNLEILLALTLFDHSLEKLLTDFQENKLITLHDTELQITQSNFFSRFPLIEKVWLKETIPSKPDITLYQLLSSSLNIDFSQLFHFRYKNQDMPNFFSDRQIERYGHQEKLTFTYYLKMGRPSIAAKLFFIDNFKRYNKITWKIKHMGANLAHTIAINNFDNAEIASGCVAFLEMLGVDSDLLRVHINTANILINKISLEEIRTYLDNIRDNSMRILSLLEEALLGELTKQDSVEFIDLLTSWKVAVKFASLHNLPYPAGYLKYCAERNLWLEFLMFAQYHLYPHHQILKLSRQFSNKNLAGNISHALGNELKLKPEEKPNDKFRRDIRKILYSKIEVGKESSSSEMSSSNDSCFIENRTENVELVNYFDEECDLFQVLCSCHRASDPMMALINAAKEYENPVFVMLASAYEPESTVLLWLIWICISIESLNLVPAINTRKINSCTIETILLEAIKKNYISTLAESFVIFLPENPLSSFTTFLKQYTKGIETTESNHSFKLFKTIIKFMKYNPQQSSSLTKEKELSFLTNRSWISKITVRLVLYTLAYAFRSYWNQLLFIEFLISEEFASEDIIPECPDLNHLRQLLKLICSSKGHVDINMAAVLKLDKYTDEDKEDELKSCIAQILKLKQFDIALDICKLESLSTDSVILEELTHKFEQQDYKSNIQQFWNRSSDYLLEHKIPPKVAADFLLGKAKEIDSNLEKYVVLKLAFTWLQQTDANDVYIQKVEVKMWWLYLQIEDWDNVQVEFVKEECLKLVSTDIRRQARIFQIKVHENFKTSLEKSNFVSLIGKLLDHGQLAQATRLEYIFNYKTESLKLIEICMKLAEGELTPQNLTPEHHNLLTKFYITARTHKRSRTLSSFSGSSIESSKEMMDLKTPLDTQQILEGLIQQIKFGVGLAGRVLCCYRISQAISRPYTRIITTYAAGALLKMTLTGDFDNKLELANDIMFYHGWSKHQICEFLCAELVSAISSHVCKESSVIEMITLWGYPLDGTMHLVLELCPLPSSLGSALLQHAAAPLSATNKESLCLAGELLIRAHDCFTADCNMEGISKVLNRSKELILKFTELQVWASIIRLLTGLGRYNEMDYVFQILQENEQFEWLLGQGTARATGLRRATMDYLRRRCPERRELSRLVALRWGLHDSAAELWEQEAKEIITNLILVAKLEMENVRQPIGPFGLLDFYANNEATIKVLENAMSCLTTAVQHHLLTERYKAAQKAASLAELVALQLGLMRNAPDRVYCILDLTAEQYNFLVVDVLEFSATKILINCYDYPTDLSQALYNNCVVKKVDTQSFLNHFELTASIAKDVVRKYLVDKNMVGKAVPNGLRTILSAIQSPVVKYRLASELGLKDVIQGMLESSVKPYLEDTVWKTGCLPTNF